MSGPRAPSGEAALAREFEAQRPRLLRLAYASTGSLAEAEDCVQEAWLRLQRAAGRDTIRDLGAWLTTTVSRLALDALGSAKSRRERYPGPWLPEPLVENPASRPPLRMRTALVNGAPGLVIRDSGGVLTVMALTVDAGRIVAIDVIRDPDKLTAVAD